MGTRMKEDRKSEKEIRALLKQPANSNCINCGSRGPQYICTTFWTFVCTICSGIHREFTHRVKSVSMAQFTPEEISYLQGGGNERAKEIYFKEVDLHRVPDNSNVDRLRDFIKHVYVDRRYAGEKITGRPSIVKMRNKEEPYDNRRRDSYQIASRGPPYEDAYEHSGGLSIGYDGRSPRFDQGNQRNSVNGRSAVANGIISDWRREDRFANRKKSEGDPKVGDKTPDSKKDPEVRPIQDILGENSISLQVIKPPKTSNDKLPNGSATQLTASPKSLVSTNRDPLDIKPEPSLIDLDADSQPPAVSQVQQSSELTTADNSVNWDFMGSAPQPPPNSKPLDSVLPPLSFPAPVSGFPTSTSASAATNGAALTSMLPPNGATVQLSCMQSQKQSFLPNGQPIVSQVTVSTSGVSSNQDLVTNPAAQTSETGITPSQVSSDVVEQPVEVKSSGRKELPADLFTAMYAPQPLHAPLWHAGFAPAVSVSVQYNTAVPMQIFPQSTKSTNPFDLSNESSPAQAAEFPYMTSLQNALPNMSNPTDLMHASNFVMTTPSWMPSQPQASPYPSGAPQLAPSFGDTAMLQDTNKAQQLSSNCPTRPRLVNVFGNDVTGFSSTNPALDLAGRMSTLAPPNPSGNPFG